jgi:hypothetical protein
MAPFEPDVMDELQTSLDYLRVAAQALEQSNMPATAALMRLQAERNQKALLGRHTPQD